MDLSLSHSKDGPGESRHPDFSGKNSGRQGAPGTDCRANGHGLDEVIVARSSGMIVIGWVWCGSERSIEERIWKVAEDVHGGIGTGLREGAEDDRIQAGSAEDLARRPDGLGWTDDGKKQERYIRASFM